MAHQGPRALERYLAALQPRIFRHRAGAGACACRARAVAARPRLCPRGLIICARRVGCRRGCPRPARYAEHFHPPRREASETIAWGESMGGLVMLPRALRAEPEDHGCSQRVLTHFRLAGHDELALDGAYAFKVLLAADSRHPAGEGHRRSRECWTCRGALRARR